MINLEERPSGPQGPQRSRAPGTQPPHLLVLQDDPDLRSQIGEYFGYLGWTTTLTASGAEGLAAFQAQPPDVVLCDLLLSDRSGLDAIAELRVTPGGARVPVVLLSAVWTTARELEPRLQELGIAEFLRKPLSIVELGRRITVLHSLPTDAGQPSMSESGQFRSVVVDRTLERAEDDLPKAGRYRPVDLAVLFARLFRTRRSGVLLTRTNTARREVVVVDGYPVQAFSTAEGESLEAMLKRERLLASGEFEAVGTHAAAAALPVVEVLLGQGTLTEEQLLRAERRRVRAVLRACFSGGPGFYELLDLDDVPVGMVEVHPVPLLGAVVRDLDFADIKTALVPQLGRVLVPGPEHGRLHTELLLPQSVGWMDDALADGLEVDTLADGVRGAVEPALRYAWLLLCTGVAMSVPSAATSRRAPPTPGPRPPSLLLESNQQLRTLSPKALALLRDYVGLTRAGHHQVLGIADDANADVVRFAWRLRNRRWRDVALAVDEPSDVRLKARELLARLSDARAVLCDPDRRRSYEQAMGLTSYVRADRTSIETLLAARAAREDGRWTDAIVEFRRLLARQPGSLEALLGVAEGLLHRSDLGRAGRVEAAALLKEAAERAPWDLRTAALRERLPRS